MQLLLCPQATLSSWQRFEAEREAVWSFINRTDKELHRDLIFNSLDSLRAEIEQSKVWNHRQYVKIVRSPRNSASLATCSKNLLPLARRSSSWRLWSARCEQICSWRKRQTLSWVPKRKKSSWSRRRPPEMLSHNCKANSTKSMSVSPTNQNAD